MGWFSFIWLKKLELRRRIYTFSNMIFHYRVTRQINCWVIRMMFWICTSITLEACIKEVSVVISVVKFLRFLFGNYCCHPPNWSPELVERRIAISPCLLICFQFDFLLHDSILLKKKIHMNSGLWSVILNFLRYFVNKIFRTMIFLIAHKALPLLVSHGIIASLFI